MSRDARTGSARARASAGGRAVVRPSARRSGAVQRPATPVTTPSADGLVVGPVPRGARVTGVLLLLAALAGVAACFPTYLVVGGRPLSLTFESM